MKLIYEKFNELNPKIQEVLNEETGVSAKKYYLEGLFTTTEEKNRNGRIYPKALFEKELTKFKEHIKNSSINTLCEWEHPARSSIDIMEAVAKIVEADMVDNKVYGKVVLLDNPKANQIKSLIENGIKIGISSRGLGSVREGIVREYSLISYDLVSEPSNFGSELSGVVEGYRLNEGVLEDKEFKINEDGSIEEVQLCTESACHMVPKEIVQESIKKRFSEVLQKMAHNTNNKQK